MSVYERLKETYLKTMTNRKTRLEYNPPKISFDLKKDDDGLVISSTNIMFAKTDYGNIAKSISLDDVSGRVVENIVYTTNDMKIYRLTNSGVTYKRCGLMGVLAIDLYKTKQIKRIGVIGNGRINLEVIKSYKALFGEVEVVIRGSSKNRGKNKELFEKYSSYVMVDKTDNLSLLNTCDVISVCTTSINKNDLISFDKLKDVSLIVAQDSGYLLDESFRINAVSITDHKEQLDAHYEDEFPYDINKYKLFNMGAKQRYNKNIVVYLYGIALADAIILEEMIKNEQTKN